MLFCLQGTSHFRGLNSPSLGCHSCLRHTCSCSYRGDFFFLLDHFSLVLVIMQLKCFIYSYIYTIIILPSKLYLYSQIIPQAVCSRYGLSLGAKGSYLVRLLLVVFFPIAYPFSKVIHAQYTLDFYDIIPPQMKHQYRVFGFRYINNFEHGTDVRLPPWKRAFCPPKTSRAKNIGGSACK